MIGARRLALASILWVVGCAGAAVQDQAGVTSLAASVSLQANRPRQVVECGGVDEVVNMTFFIDPAGCDSLVPVATTGTVAPRNEDVSIIGSLPHLPNRSDVAAAMRALNVRFSACGNSSERPFVLILVFNGLGRVERVRMLGADGSTAFGMCAANVARSTEIPPFREPRFSVAYPFGYPR